MSCKNWLSVFFNRFDYLERRIVELNATAITHTAAAIPIMAVVTRRFQALEAARALGRNPDRQASHLPAGRDRRASHMRADRRCMAATRHMEVICSMEASVACHTFKM